MTTIFGAPDLRVFCRQMGLPVAFGTVSTYPDGQPVFGLMDRPVQMKLEDGGIGGVAAVLPELRLPYNAFLPMPTADDLVMVGGTIYMVGAPTAEDDGAFLAYPLYATA